MPFPFLAGEIPSAERLGEYDTYMPVLTATTTNPNLGADGEISGWWHRVGPRLVTGGVRILFSGTGLAGGSGFYEVSLPLPADLSIMAAATSGGDLIGSGKIRDASAVGTSQLIATHLVAGALVRLWTESGVVSRVVTHDTIPWANNDRIAFNFTYMVEPGV